VTRTAIRSHPTGLIAPAIVVVALIGAAISVYLLAVRLAGGVPVCTPGGGCEVVQQSQYSSILGIPVAALGLGYSAAVAIAGFLWWRAGERRALLAAYGLGMVGVVFEAYLVYLQLVVLEAVCIWCVAYGVTVVAGLVLAAIELRRAGRT
jgi:uncharacterized membrane protein